MAGNFIGIYVAAKDINGNDSQNSITVDANYTDMTKQSVSYNLENGTGATIGGYLPAGTIKSILRAGEEVKDNITYVQNGAIIYPGDYTVIADMKDMSIYTSKEVALYILGDVNCDGIVDGNDKEALEALLSGKTQAFTAAKASEKAADLDNDGKVGKKDLQLMTQIMAASDRETERQKVIEKYYPAALTYDFLGGNGVMPIGGMHGPQGEMLTEEYFQLLKNCGINFVNNSEDVGGGVAKVRKTLMLAEEYGIGYFINDYRLNTKIGVDSNGNQVVNENAAVLGSTEIAEHIGSYGYYDSLLGINVIDEPVYKDATGGNNKVKRMEYYTDIAATLNKYTNLSGFINILPEDSHGIGMGASGYLVKSYYNEYWKQYKEAKPQVYSVDDYPTADNANEGVTNAKGYFGSLGKIRKESLADDVPFWYYVQAGGDFEENSSTSVARIATEPETYWNVNTALAFGAKGIEYFPLVQPEEMAKDTGNPNRNGLINASGDATTFYTWAKRINKHIAAIDEVLMKAVSTDIVASGGYAKSQAAGKLSCIDGDVTEIKTGSASGTLENVTSSDANYGALVGCFDYRDTEAFYVVNYNADAAADAAATITLTFDSDYDVRVIQDAKAVYSTTTNKILTLTIPSGQGVLVVLEDRAIQYTDVDTYHTGENCSVPDAEPGYVFAGWYTDKECTRANALKSTDTTTTTAYAKFVPEGVLEIKAQIKAGTTSESKMTDIRFVTSVDTLDYKAVGFEVAANGNTKTYGSNVVYKQLYAVDSNEIMTTYIPKEVFSSVSTYFKACTITGVPNAAFGMKWAVRPYWITLDGTRVYGETAEKTVNMGL